MGAVLVPIAAAAALALAAVLLRGRRAIFWFALILPFIPVEYIDRYHARLPTVLKWSPLIGTLGTAALATLWLPHIRTQIPRGVRRTMIGIILFSFFSMLMNGTALPAFVVAQRGWIVAVSAMVALKAGYPDCDREQLHAFLVKMGLISSAVSLFQRLVIVPITPGIDAADRVTGLFSVGYLQLYFHLFCIGVLLSYWLNGRQLLPWPSLPVLLVLVLSLAVGNEKASLPYMLVLVTCLVVSNGLRATLRRSWKPLAAMLAMPALLLAGFAAVNDPSQDPEQGELYANQITDPEYVHRYLFGDGDTRFTSGGALRRGAAALFAYDEIKDDRLQLLIGAGPGETAESRLPGASGTIAERNPGYSINRLSLSMALGDTGILGVLLHTAFLVVVWFTRTRGAPPEHDRVRETFVILSAGYAVYANMTNEAIYCLLMAVVLYPLSAGRPAGPGPVEESVAR